MGFVIGVLAALLVVFLLGYVTVKKPVFGKILITLSIFLILFAIFFYFQKDKRVENKKQRIPVEQIELSNIEYGYAYGSNYKLTAKVENNSAHYRLQSVLLEISFLHCKDTADSQKAINGKASKEVPEARYSPADCQLIEKKLHKVNTRLAPGASDTIETYLLLDEALQSQNMRWQVKITSGMAR